MCSESHHITSHCKPYEIMISPSKLLPTLIASLLAATLALADVVETKNGSRLIGKVTKIADGKITLSTTYAGELAISQGEVAAITTEEPVAVRLSSGNRIDGKLATEGGSVKIAGKEGTLSTPVDKIAASWAAGGEDPLVSSMRRRWTLQTTADIVGKDGNTESTGIGLGFVAALVSPQDALKFYGAYNYATTTVNNVETKSADETKLGIDYSSFFSSTVGWFVRSEFETDNVEGIDLRSTSDFGGTYRFIKNDRQSLVGRLGVGYRFESYPIGPDNKGTVFSVGLNHSFVINKYASVVTDLSYLPAMDDFADYRFGHDTAIEVPISAGFWKLRIGVNNQYTSRPVGSRENLDTTYYTRLLLNWR